MYINKVYMNDHITLCYKACKACWGKPLGNEYFDMVNFIENRVKVGHESVLEHSNFVMELIINEVQEPKLLNEFISLIGDMKYLNIAPAKDHHDQHFLIGGSIRAYKELIRTATTPNSELLKVILRTLTSNLDPCYFRDFINAGLCSEDDFSKTCFHNYTKEDECHNKAKLGLSIVENVDPYEELFMNLSDPYLYSTSDLYRMLTITINFTDLSRAASHQLVRHRNGITQSSMRYIDQSEATYYVPESLKEQEFVFNCFGYEVHATFEDILKEELHIYRQIREQGAVKEDARGILGTNIASKDLYMTFTYKTFIKFLELRTDSHAQEEIRNRALELFDHFVNKTALLPENLYDYLIPYFDLHREELVELDSEIDELIEEKLEEMEETWNDFEVDEYDYIPDERA